MYANKVRNPITNRMINVGGDTYNALIASGYRLIGDTLYPPTQPLYPVPVTVFPTVPTNNPVFPTVVSPILPTMQSVNKPVNNPIYPTVPITQPKIPSPKIPSPKIVPGNIPTITAFEEEMMMLEREEDAKRTKLCGICKGYYIDRTRPFTTQEINNLGKIIQACDQCTKLCDAKYLRSGITNARECQQYRTAAAMGQKQHDRLEADLRVKAMNAAIMAGKDIDQYFPQVPR